MRSVLLATMLAVQTGCDELEEDEYLLVVRNEGTEPVILKLQSPGFHGIYDEIPPGFKLSRTFLEGEFGHHWRATVVRSSDGFEFWTEKLDADDFNEPGDSLTITVHP